MYQDLNNVGHEEADSACDQIEFVSAALAAMLDTYNDGIACGCMSILNNATEVLQAYIDQQRRAEWEEVSTTSKSVEQMLAANNG